MGGCLCVCECESVCASEQVTGELLELTKLRYRTLKYNRGVLSGDAVTETSSEKTINR